MTAKSPQTQAGTNQPGTASRPANTFPLDLDKVSLEQALRDFEIANVRVLDLTQRLITSERKRAEVENELQQLRLQHQPNSAAPVHHTSARLARELALQLGRGAARRAIELAGVAGSLARRFRR